MPHSPIAVAIEPGARCRTGCANAMGVEFRFGNMLIGGTQFGHPVRCVRGDGS